MFRLMDDARQDRHVKTGGPWTPADSRAVCAASPPSFFSSFSSSSSFISISLLFCIAIFFSRASTDARVQKEQQSWRPYLFISVKYDDDDDNVVGGTGSLKTIRRQRDWMADYLIVHRYTAAVDCRNQLLQDRKVGRGGGWGIFKRATLSID